MSAAAPELLARLTQESRQHAGVGGAQLTLAHHPDRLRRLCNQVRVLVLPTLALPTR